MILTYGDVSCLTGKKWYVLELRSERTSEEVLKRMGKEVPKIFQSDPLEVFIPVVSRDLDVFQLATENYVFIRTVDTSKLSKLRSITGVVQVMCEGDKRNKFITVEDEYVQGLITEAEQRHMSRPSGIRIGSFVRLLDGFTRDFCGEVISISNHYACVQLDLKTKIIQVETPLTNLLDLSHVPKECRVFYYSDIVKDFVQYHGGEALQALQNDLKYQEVEEYKPLPPEALRPKKETPKTFSKTRQFTVTAEIRRAMNKGITHPLDLVKMVAERINKGEIKPTTNLTIFWHTVRSMVFKHLQTKHPDLCLTDYKQIRDIWPDYAIPMSVIKEMIPGIPVKSGSVE